MQWRSIPKDQLALNRQVNTVALSCFWNSESIPSRYQLWSRRRIALKRTYCNSFTLLFFGRGFIDNNSLKINMIDYTQYIHSSFASQEKHKPSTSSQKHDLLNFMLITSQYIHSLFPHEDCQFRINLSHFERKEIKYKHFKYKNNPKH